MYEHLEDNRKIMEKSIPMKRFQQPEDVASLVLFLASDIGRNKYKWQYIYLRWWCSKKLSIQKRQEKHPLSFLYYRLYSFTLLGSFLNRIR